MALALRATRLLRPARWQLAASPAGPSYLRAGRAVASAADLPVGARFQVPHHGRAHVLSPGEEMPQRPQRGLSVAILGASGIMGRQIAASLAANLRQMAGIESPTLQLVGRRKGQGAGMLISLCSEFRDAYEEVCPNLEVVLDLDQVRADIIIMCAGATLSKEFKAEAEVTRANLEIFDEHATALVERNPAAMVLVVSNPVEFGVDAMVNAGFDPQRVIGTGAFLQTMRFRREVASELGVPRQHLSGLVLGRHGLGMVPIWSSVRLAPHASTADAVARLEQLKEEGLARLPLDIEVLRPLAVQLRELTQGGQALAASALVNQQPPEFRAVLRRYLTFFSGPPFARVGNAEAVCRLVGDILSNKSTFTAAQVCLSGEYLGINGVTGAPVVVSNQGATVWPMELAPAEADALRASADGLIELKRAASAVKAFRRALSAGSKPKS